MALLPQNPRSQKLVVVTLLAVGLAAVYQQLVWTPKNAEHKMIAVRLDTLDSLNHLAKIEVAKGTATKMKQEADTYARELAGLRLELVAIQIERITESRASDRGTSASGDELDQLAIVVAESSWRTRTGVEHSDEMPLIDYRNADE